MKYIFCISLLLVNLSSCSYKTVKNCPNCRFACGESASGGKITQNELQLALKTDTNSQGTDDRLWKKWSELTGKSFKQLPTGLTPESVVEYLSKGNISIALRLKSPDGQGHEVLINRIAQKTYVGLSGKTSIAYQVYVMDPMIGPYVRISDQMLRDANPFVLFK